MVRPQGNLKVEGRVNVTVCRLEFNETETIGVMMVDGKAFCWTLELPWRSNVRDISCIPEGRYLCTRGPSVHYGEVFWIKDVEGREEVILGHVGNWHTDTKGCVVLGMETGWDYERKCRMVMRSREAVGKWEAKTLGADELILTVRI